MDSDPYMILIVCTFAPFNLYATQWMQPPTAYGDVMCIPYNF